ncbi:MCE family protein [Acidovorax sp. SUPP3434]|uniref:PqiB family protein n=1 Tax=Acidovorax sp. SUPP3434 TaxID=2920880 RepID=UPI0023DE391E|nr:MlaD family protein [Acidovorax sp. SUPP3434]GKT02113.1 MCE family protein [Acidovorax sp. SUPP3434]
MVGISMLAHTWYARGPDIQIRFKTAAGLEAGKTQVRFKDVVVGGVSDVTLSDDHSSVIATVSLKKSAAGLAREDSRFWVVRPRVGMGGISGIDTLLSGAYIGVDLGSSRTSGKHFDGLELPPPVLGGMQGRSFSITADDMGSLDIGSPVYFRRLEVGRVTSYSLNDDGTGILLQVFVDAPYHRFVGADTRFWNASGVDLSLSASGLKVNTQALSTVLAGGIAFATPDGENVEPAPDDVIFPLRPDRQTAMAPPDSAPQNIRLLFDQPVRGLVVGAPVFFAGVEVGNVSAIQLDYTPWNRRFITIVDTRVYASRLGQALQKLPQLKGTTEDQGAQFLKMMVADGLRAQVRTANLLTGQLYVSLDFIRNAAPARFDVAARPLTLPTVRGDFDRLQEQLGSIVTKLEKIPLDSIGRNLDTSLTTLNQTMGRLDTTLEQLNQEVLPEATQTMGEMRETMTTARNLVGEDAPLRQDIHQTLLEVQRTSRSVRNLTDLLGEHPQSLIWGRPRSDRNTRPEQRGNNDPSP